MKLFYEQTINPRKACVVARYLNSPVDYVHIDLSKGENRTPEYLAINPNGKVPALEDGDLKLWEANAIMCHLARTAKSDLWPDGAKQVEVMRWLSWNADHFTRHAGTLYFNYIIKPAIGIGAPDEAAVKEATGFVRRFAAVLNDHLRGRKGGLDLPPTAAAPPPGAAQAEGATATPGSVFDPSFGANKDPVAPPGKKRSFILDPLLD